MSSLDTKDYIDEMTENHKRYPRNWIPLLKKEHEIFQRQRDINTELYLMKKLIDSTPIIVVMVCSCTNRVTKEERYFDISVKFATERELYDSDYCDYDNLEFVLNECLYEGWYVNYPEYVGVTQIPLELHCIAPNGV